MPEIGEIKSSLELGHKEWGGHKHIWQACMDCGKEKWFGFSHGIPARYCNSCSAKIRWKANRRPIYYDGYVLIRLEANDFFYPMIDNRGYVREHRLIMAKHLGRNLHSWEIIHHINGDKKDNRIENLQLISELGHRQLTIFEKKIYNLEERIAKLEKENYKLRSFNH